MPGDTAARKLWTLWIELGASYCCKFHTILKWDNKDLSLGQSTKKPTPHQHHWLLILYKRPSNHGCVSLRYGNIIRIFSKQKKPKALRFNRFSPLGSQRSGTDSLFPSSTATSSLDSLLPRPRKPEICGGEVVTAKVPKKTRKKKHQLFKA